MNINHTKFEERKQANFRNFAPPTGELHEFRSEIIISSCETLERTQSDLSRRMPPSHKKGHPALPDLCNTDVLHRLSQLHATHLLSYFSIRFASLTHRCSVRLTFLRPSRFNSVHACSQDEELSTDCPMLSVLPIAKTSLLTPWNRPGSSESLMTSHVLCCD